MTPTKFPIPMKKFSRSATDIDSRLEIILILPKTLLVKSSKQLFPIYNQNNEMVIMVRNSESYLT